MSWSPLARPDLRPLAAYERARNAFRAFVIQLKKQRRVTLGPSLSVVFENRRTVLYEVQEVLRSARIVEPDRIEAELERANELLPKPHELRLTLFVEVEDPASELIGSLRQIERCLALGIGDADGISVRSVPAEERHHDRRTATVHHLRLPFPDTALEALGREDLALSLLVDHPVYRVRVPLDPGLAAELRREVLAGAPGRSRGRSRRSTLRIEPEAGVATAPIPGKGRNR